MPWPSPGCVPLTDSGGFQAPWLRRSGARWCTRWRVLAGATPAVFHRNLYQGPYNLFSCSCRLLILKCLAPRHGFEPRFTAPKAAVLPLDDRGMDGENYPPSVAFLAALTR